MAPQLLENIDEYQSKIRVRIFFFTNSSIKLPHNLEVFPFSILASLFCSYTSFFIRGHASYLYNEEA